MALGLTQSKEYYSNIVTAAYNKYLGWAPDAVGLAYWVNLMQNEACRMSKLEPGFISSQEFITNSGGLGTKLGA